MTQFAVFGNPVRHSRSPEIHQAFARQRAVSIDYQRIEAPLDQFAACVRDFFAAGGVGANVTLPFKEQAWALCQQRSARAESAGAVNTLWQQAGQLCGDNTDGAGLITDLRANLDWPLAGQHVLLLGAGGAVRGILGPLLAERPAQVIIANRSAGRARDLALQYAGSGVPVFGCGLDALTAEDRFDLLINGISAGLDGTMPALPASLLTANSRCYDMIYGSTPFLHWAALNGCRWRSDGLGMLVEQAALSFAHWHGWQPDTDVVIQALRDQDASAK